MSDRLKQAEELGELLGGIARCAFRLADESEENAVTGECTSDAYLFLELARALAACDHLSEPEEGYVTDGWYRALVKLRQLLMEAQAREIRLVAQGERVSEDLHCAVELLRQVYRTPTVVYSDKWVRDAARLEAVFNISPTATLPQETDDD